MKRVTRDLAFFKEAVAQGLDLVLVKNERLLLKNYTLMIRRKEVFLNFYLKPKLENADMENR